MGQHTGSQLDRLYRMTSQSCLHTDHWGTENTDFLLHENFDGLLIAMHSTTKHIIINKYKCKNTEIYEVKIFVARTFKQGLYSQKGLARV